MKEIKIILMCLMVTGLLFGCGGSSGSGGSDDGGGGTSVVINSDGSLTFSGTLNPPPGSNIDLTILNECGTGEKEIKCTLSIDVLNADGSFNITIPKPNEAQLYYGEVYEGQPDYTKDAGYAVPLAGDKTTGNVLFCLEDNLRLMFFYSNMNTIFMKMGVNQGWNILAAVLPDESDYYKDDDEKQYVLPKDISDTCTWTLVSMPE